MSDERRRLGNRVMSFLGLGSVAGVAFILAAAATLGTWVAGNQSALLAILFYECMVAIICGMVYVGISSWYLIDQYQHEKKERLRKARHKQLSLKIWDELEGVVEYRDRSNGPEGPVVSYPIAMDRGSFDYEKPSLGAPTCTVKSDPQCLGAALQHTVKPQIANAGLCCPHCNISYSARYENVIKNEAGDYLRRRTEELLAQLANVELGG